MIYSKVDIIKNTSFLMQHEIINDKVEIIAEAKDSIVFYNFDKNTKLIIPNEIKNKIIELGKIISHHHL